MERLPTISVIMTVYNAEHYLYESINSVLNQTFFDFEFIIIDDGSIDNSINAIKKFKDSRIQLIQEKHQNYIDLLNKLIKYARGKYIVKMDDDDIMIENRLEKQYTYMENNLDIDVCGSWAETFGKNSYLIQTPISNLEIQSLLLLKSPIVHPTVIFRKSSIDSYCSKFSTVFYNPNYKYADDYKLWIDLAMNNWKFANIPEVLLKYRLSDKQITSKYKNECTNLSSAIQKEYMAHIFYKMLSSNSAFKTISSSILKLNKNGDLTFKDLQLIMYSLYRCFLKST